jgi:hypothetical protein
VTGLTRTEAAIGVTKVVIRGTGQDIIRSDQWFASQPGIRYVEAGVGIASNPLTYSPLIINNVSSFRPFAFIDDVDPFDLSLRGNIAPSNGKTFLNAHDPRTRPGYDPGALHNDHTVARVFGGEDTRSIPAAMNLRKGGLEGELRRYENSVLSG